MKFYSTFILTWRGKPCPADLLTTIFLSRLRTLDLPHFPFLFSLSPCVQHGAAVYCGYRVRVAHRQNHTGDGIFFFFKECIFSSTSLPFPRSSTCLKSQSEVELYKTVGNGLVTLDDWNTNENCKISAWAGVEPRRHPLPAYGNHSLTISHCTVPPDHYLPSVTFI